MRFSCGSLRGCRTQSQIAELEKKRPAGISRNRFCQLMDICRSGLYYEPAEESKENQEIMKIMDMYFMDHPTTGKRGFRDYLRLIGYKVNIKRVRRLIDVMGIEPIYPRKCLSKGGVSNTLMFTHFCRNVSIYMGSRDSQYR